MGSYEKGGTEEDGGGFVSEYLGPGWSLGFSPHLSTCGKGSVLGGVSHQPSWFSGTTQLGKSSISPVVSMGREGGI